MEIRVLCFAQRQQRHNGNNKCNTVHGFSQLFLFSSGIFHIFSGRVCASFLHRLCKGLRIDVVVYENVINNILR